jgi:hypothetical protein
MWHFPVQWWLANTIMLVSYYFCLLKSLILSFWSLLSDPRFWWASLKDIYWLRNHVVVSFVTIVFRSHVTIKCCPSSSISRACFVTAGVIDLKHQGAQTENTKSAIHVAPELLGWIRVHNKVHNSRVFDLTYFSNLSVSISTAPVCNRWGCSVWYMRV